MYYELLAAMAQSLPDDDMMQDKSPAREYLNSLVDRLAARQAVYEFSHKGEKLWKQLGIGREQYEEQIAGYMSACRQSGDLFLLPQNPCGIEDLDSLVAFDMQERVIVTSMNRNMLLVGDMLPQGFKKGRIKLGVGYLYCKPVGTVIPELLLSERVLKQDIYRNAASFIEEAAMLWYRNV